MQPGRAGYNQVVSKTHMSSNLMSRFIWHNTFPCQQRRTERGVVFLCSYQSPGSNTSIVWTYRERFRNEKLKTVNSYCHNHSQYKPMDSGISHFDTNQNMNYTKPPVVVGYFLFGVFIFSIVSSCPCFALPSHAESLSIVNDQSWRMCFWCQKFLVYMLILMK